jgi:hypothetical protein
MNVINNNLKCLVAGECENKASIFGDDILEKLQIMTGMMAMIRMLWWKFGNRV